MTAVRIPFNRASFAGPELDRIASALRAGHISGDGPETRACHQLLESLLGIPKALLTTSCTHALDMSALLLDVGPGDEVIVPSYAFTSTINAFVLRGATPVFADIRPDTFNIDEVRLPELVSPRTRAIVLLHYAGVGCEMDTVLPLATQHSIAVVEDAAHALFGRYRGRLLGTFGTLSALSFHETKNFTCGEGGALLINDAALVERAEILREKGTNRTRFFRGEVDRYTWVDVGSSYLPSDLLAAILRAQLEARDAIQRRRREIWAFYADALADWADAIGARLPIVPSHCEQTYHMFTLFMPSQEARDGLIAWLKSQGILAVFHYLPLDDSPMGRRVGRTPRPCVVARDVSARLVRLPFYTSLTAEDQRAVVEAVREFAPAAAAQGR
jgi:dTDP-4-amino-4,6-dideoxygalactose transaminase